MVTSHTRSPLGRTPGFTLTPVIFVIPGDFSFVLLCTHRAPGSSRPACFSEDAETIRFAIFRLGLHRFRSTHDGLVPRIASDCIGTSKTSVLKNPSTAFSCRKVVWILTLYLSPQLLTWRTLLRQLQPQHFEHFWQFIKIILCVYILIDGSEIFNNIAPGTSFVSRHRQNRFTDNAA